MHDGMEKAKWPYQHQQELRQTREHCTYIIAGKDGVARPNQQELMRKQELRERHRHDTMEAAGWPDQNQQGLMQKQERCLRDGMRGGKLASTPHPLARA